MTFGGHMVYLRPRSAICGPSAATFRIYQNTETHVRSSEDYKGQWRLQRTVKTTKSSEDYKEQWRLQKHWVAFREDEAWLVYENRMGS